MAEREPVSLDALNGLLKERQRYEEWLTALEDKRSSTSQSVYQRVQADYQTRLREVSSKLADRAGELRENIEAQLNELNRIFALSVKEKQAGAIALGRPGSEDGSGGGSRAPISPVVPRPAIPE